MRTLSTLFFLIHVLTLFGLNLVSAQSPHSSEKSCNSEDYPFQIDLEEAENPSNLIRDLKIMFAETLSENVLYGEWHRIPSEKEESDPSDSIKFSAIQGSIALKLQKSCTYTFGIELLGIHNSTSVVFYEEIHDKFKFTLSKDGVLINTNKLKYIVYPGDSLFSNKCSNQRFSLQFINKHTQKVYDPTVDEREDVVLKITMLSEGCLLNFEAQLGFYDEGAWYWMSAQILFYGLFTLWIFAIGFATDYRTIGDRVGSNKAKTLQYFLLYIAYYCYWSYFRQSNFAEEFTPLFLSYVLYGLMSAMMILILDKIFFSSRRILNLYIIMLIFLPPIVLMIYFSADLPKEFHYSLMVKGSFIVTLIPIIDISKAVTSVSIPKYDYRLYYGFLLPLMLNILYFTVLKRTMFFFLKEIISEFIFQFQLIQLSIFVTLILAFFILPLQVRHAQMTKSPYVLLYSLDPEDECGICLQNFIKQETKQEPLEAGNKVPKLVCGHLYHEKCLAQWIKTKAQCPLCASSLDYLL